MPMKKSPRPMRRPEADESTTRAMTPSMRPRMRPEDLEDRMEMQRMRDRIESSNRQDQGPSRREMEQGFAEGGRVRSTRSMPSGAQQYTRGDGTVGRMRTIDRAIRETEDMPFRAESGLNRAFVDESRARPSERAFRDSLRTQSQALQEDLANRRGAKKFAEGGMVTGSRAQISGTKFSGTF